MHFNGRRPVAVTEGDEDLPPLTFFGEIFWIFFLVLTLVCYFLFTFFWWRSEWHRSWVSVPYEEQVHMRFTWSWAFFFFFLHNIVVSGVLFLLFFGLGFLFLFFCDELNTSLAPVACSVAS